VIDHSLFCYAEYEFDDQTDLLRHDFKKIEVKFAKKNDFGDYS